MSGRKSRIKQVHIEAEPLPGADAPAVEMRCSKDERPRLVDQAARACTARSSRFENTRIRTCVPAVARRGIAAIRRAGELAQFRPKCSSQDISSSAVREKHGLGGLEIKSKPVEIEPHVVQV